MFESREQKLITYIEQYWYEYNVMPSIDQMTLATNLPDSTLRTILKTADFQAALRNRGLDLIPSSKLLSPEQLAAANSILDFADDRTSRQKLRDLSVTPRQYSAWLKQAAFKTYMTARAEQLFGDAMPDAHVALVNSVKRGDVSAMKLFYEMSGRWSSRSVEEVNIEFLMMKLIEIIQKHVHDPLILQSIADDIGGLVPSRALSAVGPPVGLFGSSNGHAILESEVDDEGPDDPFKFTET